jgi:hypothetical protein
MFGGGVVASVGNVIDKLHTSEAEKLAARNEAAAIILRAMEQVDSTYLAEVTAKRDVMVAEMAQGDTYTKRARPTIIYGGLVFIAINYVVAPIMGRLVALLRSFGDLSPEQVAALADMSAPLADLPAEFWAAWGGVSGLYVLSRGREKLGAEDMGLLGGLFGGKR